MSIQSSTKTTIEISIRLIILFLLISWCLLLLFPFIVPVMWAVILSVSLSPLYELINKVLGGRAKLSAIILIFILLALIFVPSYFFVDSIVVNLSKLGKGLQSGDLQIPEPDASVKSWPVIGNRIYAVWEGLFNNLEEVVATYSKQLKAVGKWVLNMVMGLTSGILQMGLSLIIAGVLLATAGTRNITLLFFNKLAGERGAEYADLTERTIRNVTKGVLGVAVIQSILIGTLLFMVGIPYPGVISLLVLILSIMQLPPAIVTFPVFFYLYSHLPVGMATLWTVLISLASVADNILKPILLGKGATVPMLVIFLGSIGGFIVSGFLGLFTGAIVLSLGYKLLMSWLDDDDLATGSK